MATELQAAYDPILGASALASFGVVGANQNATLSGKSLREGLLASLWTVELLAAQAGLVPWIQIPGQGRGVAVLGAARERLDHADEAVKTIYLAAHGAARQAQSHARISKSSTPEGAAALDAHAISEIGDFGVTAIVLTVMGVAAICATAWFAKGVVEQIVTTHGDDLRATYAADTAAKLAMAEIAAGQPVDPSVWSTLAGVASREKKDSLVAPGIIVGGVAAAAAFVGWEIWKGHAHG